MPLVCRRSRLALLIRSALKKEAARESLGGCATFRCTPAAQKCYTQFGRKYGYLPLSGTIERVLFASTARESPSGWLASVLLVLALSIKKTEFGRAQAHTCPRLCVRTLEDSKLTPRCWQRRRSHRGRCIEAPNQPWAQRAIRLPKAAHATTGKSRNTQHSWTSTKVKTRKRSAASSSV